jgi:hypothetical protein
MCSSFFRTPPRDTQDALRGCIRLVAAAGRHVVVARQEARAVVEETRRRRVQVEAEREAALFGFGERARHHDQKPCRPLA